MKKTPITGCLHWLFSWLCYANTRYRLEFDLQPGWIVNWVLTLPFCKETSLHMFPSCYDFPLSTWGTAIQRRGLLFWINIIFPAVSDSGKILKRFSSISQSQRVQSGKCTALSGHCGSGGAVRGLSMISLKPFLYMAKASSAFTFYSFDKNFHQLIVVLYTKRSTFVWAPFFASGQISTVTSCCSQASRLYRGHTAKAI